MLEGGCGVGVGLGGEEGGFVGDVGCSALRQAEGVPFPFVDDVGDFGAQGL